MSRQTSCLFRPLAIVWILRIRWVRQQTVWSAFDGIGLVRFVESFHGNLSCGWNERIGRNSQQSKFGRRKARHDGHCGLPLAAGKSQSVSRTTCFIAHSPTVWVFGKDCQGPTVQKQTKKACGWHWRQLQSSAEGCTGGGWGRFRHREGQCVQNTVEANEPGSLCFVKNSCDLLCSHLLCCSFQVFFRSPVVFIGHRWGRTQCLVPVPCFCFHHRIGYFMEGILSEEELGRFPVRRIRATSKPSLYRSQSSGITARGTEPGGVMVRGHEGPWRVSSTHVVLRAGLLQIQGLSVETQEHSWIAGTHESFLKFWALTNVTLGGDDGEDLIPNGAKFSSAQRKHSGKRVCELKLWYLEQFRTIFARYNEDTVQKEWTRKLHSLEKRGSEVLEPKRQDSEWGSCPTKR